MRPEHLDGKPHIHLVIHLPLTMIMNFSYYWPRIGLLFSLRRIRTRQLYLFPRELGESNDHITLLILAWTYILSGLEYSHHESKWDDQNVLCQDIPTNSANVNIDLGDIGDDAARWWLVVLAEEGGWKTSVSTGRGEILHPPWYTKLVCEQHLQSHAILVPNRGPHLLNTRRRLLQQRYNISQTTASFTT